MRRGLCVAGDAVTALLLAAALGLSGILLAQQVVASSLYKQSKIISSIFSQESVGITGFVRDARGRDVLMKFAGALANAYVSFELIPVNEASTFSAVYESMGPVIEIEGFSYHRKDLTISGTSPDEAGYREFLRRLRAKSYFESVSGHFYETVDNSFRFEIRCVTAPYSYTE